MPVPANEVISYGGSLLGQVIVVGVLIAAGTAFGLWFLSQEVVWLGAAILVGTAVLAVAWFLGVGYKIIADAVERGSAEAAGKA